MRERVSAATPVPRTLVDRVVGYFNPVAGAKRFRARSFLALVGGYTGGKRDRRSTRNWRPKETSANADILVDLPDLRARSRDLVRNNPIATGAIATVVTNVVGDGLTLQSRIDRKALGLADEQATAWQAAAEREWELFCETCDFTRAQSHYELQALILRSAMESGDVLIVRRYRKDRGDAYGTKIQVVEADRVCNKDRGQDTLTTVAGVNFDASGIATGYQVASRHPDDFTLGTKAELTWSAVPARDADSGRALAILLYDRLRPDQARGLPYLAPVIESLKMLGDYADAEVRAAVIAAMFTAFIETPAEDETEGSVIGSDAAADVADPKKEIALEDAGAIVALNPGQKVNTANPGRPNPVFDAFVASVYKQIGVALELPYELVIKSFQASYSASRAALEMAWQFFRKRRSWLAWRLCQPTYEWCIEEAVASGRLDAPGFFDDPIVRQAYLGSDWIGPVRPNLDPKKESDADKQDLEMKVTTRSEIIARRTGGTFEQKIAKLAEEDAVMEAAGVKSEPPAAPLQPGQSQPPDAGAGDPPNPDKPDIEDGT